MRLLHVIVQRFFGAKNLVTNLTAVLVGSWIVYALHMVQYVAFAGSILPTLGTKV